MQYTILRYHVLCKQLPQEKLRYQEEFYCTKHVPLKLYAKFVLSIGIRKSSHIHDLFIHYYLQGYNYEWAIEMPHVNYQQETCQHYDSAYSSFLKWWGSLYVMLFNIWCMNHFLRIICNRTWWVLWLSTITTMQIGA